MILNVSLARKSWEMTGLTRDNSPRIEESQCFLNNIENFNEQFLCLIYRRLFSIRVAKRQADGLEQKAKCDSKFATVRKTANFNPLDKLFVFSSFHYINLSFFFYKDVAELSIFTNS